MKLTNLNFDALIQFHYVAHLQSLTRAADYLGVSAPAVTHSLRKLERSLDVVLCKRGKAGFQLTEHGRTLFEKTKLIVNEVDSFLQALKRPTEYGGILTIGMIDNLDNAVAQRLLDETAKRFPQMKLNLLITDAEEISRGVASGDIDIGFGLFHKKSDKLRYVTIGKSTMRYFISRKHPLWSVKNVTKEDLVDCHVAWVESKKRSTADLEAKIFVPHPGYKMKVAAYSNHLDGALAILQSGFAVVPIPPTYIAKLANRRNIRELTLKTNAPEFIEEAVFDEQRFHHPPAAYIVESLAKLRQ